MRSLLFPLALALAGFGLLVYLTYPPPVQGDDSPAGASTDSTGAEIPEQREHTALHGTLVDESGQPLTVSSVEGSAVVEGRAVSFGAEVDDLGRFAVERRPDLPAGDVELRLWTRDARGSVDRFANFETVLDPSAPVDVRTIALGQLPLLVSGVVVDQDGAPVARAALGVLEAKHRGAAERLEFGPVPAPHPIDGFTDAEGAFRLFGLPKAHGLALQVEAQELEAGSPAPRLFAQRAENVELVLAAPGSLNVTIALQADGSDVDLGFSRVWLSAWPAGAPRSDELRLLIPTIECSKAGHATFEDLAPGVYDVSVHIASPENPPARVLERVRVEHGESPAAPSETSVTLDDLRIFRIRAVDESNTELTERIEFRLPGQTTWLAATPTSADPERPGVVSAWPRLDLRVSAADHEPQVLTNVDGDRSVVLTSRE